MSFPTYDIAKPVLIVDLFYFACFESLFKPRLVIAKTFQCYLLLCYLNLNSKQVGSKQALSIICHT